MASAEFSELNYLYDAVVGYSSDADPVMRKRKTLKQSSPAADPDYEANTHTFVWENSIRTNRASTKTYKQNPNGIDPEREGIWGSATMYVDS